jgi:hypothetical protein
MRVESGERIIAALQRITTRLTPTPDPNHELFDKLRVYYEVQLNALHDDLVRIEREHLAEEKRKRGRGPGGPDVNYWDGAEQSIGYYANTEQMSHPPGGSVHWVESTPGNIINRIPLVYFLADYLKLDEPGLFVSFRHVGYDPKREFDPATGGEYFSNVPGTEVTVSYNGRAIVTRSVRSTQGRIGSIDESEQFNMWLAFFTNNWTQGENLKAMFEHSATDGPIDPDAAQLLADTTRRVEETLKRFRGEVYTTASPDHS